MKVLKFRDNLMPLILSGQKNSTWRLFDDKSLIVGDEIELKVFGTNDKFAEAKIIKVVEKRFGDLTDNDKEGHEQFKDDSEMYSTYSDYYHLPVDSDTLVKIIWFELR
jgi:hypothetical protein